MNVIGRFANKKKKKELRIFCFREGCDWTIFFQFFFVLSVGTVRETDMLCVELK